MLKRKAGEWGDFIILPLNGLFMGYVNLRVRILILIDNDLQVIIFIKRILITISEIGTGLCVLAKLDGGRIFGRVGKTCVLGRVGLL